jgi:hypothetical protein
MGRVSRSILVATMLGALLIGGAPAASAAPPTNDDFGSATVVGSLPFSDTGSTVESTTPASDPHSCLDRAANSVWYAFTPAADVTVEFDTFGSDFDTVLSAYTGAQGSLTQIACNDDTDGLQSKIKWQATAGTEYHVMLNGFFGYTGNFMLHADAEPFFTIDLTVSGRGSVDAATGVPTISGTVSCSRSGYFAMSPDVRLRQQIGDLTLRAKFPSVYAACGPDPGPWELTAAAQNGPFERGRARLVHIGWDGFSTEGDESFSQVGDPQTVRLRR